MVKVNRFKFLHLREESRMKEVEALCPKLVTAFNIKLYSQHDVFRMKSPISITLLALFRSYSGICY